MKENKVREEARAKCGYAPPRIEMFASEPGSLLAGTNPPTPTPVENEFGGTNKRGELQTTISAKILDREFSFSDVWEE